MILIYQNCETLQVLVFTGADDPIRTGDPLITSETLWPAELHRLFEKQKYNKFHPKSQFFSIISVFSISLLSLTSRESFIRRNLHRNLRDHICSPTVQDNIRPSFH